jgi:hypothetical protein
LLNEVYSFIGWRRNLCRRGRGRCYKIRNGINICADEKRADFFNLIPINEQQKYF